jgi:hypothetical protein
MKNYASIICFKIKNPSTLHLPQKYKPTFVFSVSVSIRKKWGYERKLLTVVFVVVYRVFLIFILLFYHLFAHNNYFVLGK